MIHLQMISIFYGLNVKQQKQSETERASDGSFAEKSNLRYKSSMSILPVDVDVI